jgi:hypothetical protein
MHTSIAASLLASCIDCVCETRPSSFWSVSLLLSAVAADDENEAIFLPQAKIAINSVLPAPNIFRNQYSKLQSVRTEYKCILFKSDSVIETIAAAKIDTQTPCRCQVYRPRPPRSLPRSLPGTRRTHRHMLPLYAEMLCVFSFIIVLHYILNQNVHMVHILFAAITPHSFPSVIYA